MKKKHVVYENMYLKWKTRKCLELFSINFPHLMKDLFETKNFPSYPFGHNCDKFNFFRYTKIWYIIVPIQLRLRS